MGILLEHLRLVTKIPGTIRNHLPIIIIKRSRSKRFWGSEIELGGTLGESGNLICVAQTLKRVMGWWQIFNFFCDNSIKNRRPF